MRNWLLAGILIAGIGIPVIMAGCGQTSGSSTTTTTLPSGSVSISGSLYSGTVRTSAVRISSSGPVIMGVASTPLESYSVVAVGTIDNKVYFSETETDASGSFTVSNLPEGESFYLELVDSNKKFVAPVSFGATIEGIVMAVTPEAGSGAINLGEIVYEAGKGAAVPTLEVAATKQDKSSTATKKSGEAFVPVGGGILGRGTGEAYYTGPLKDAVDEDYDGLPDVIDVDDNGDGKVDGLDPTPRLSGRVEVALDGVSHSNAFSNLPLIYEIYPTYKSGALNTEPVDVATASNLAIEVVMSSGTSPSDFSEIKVVEGPAWIDTAKISSDSPPALVGTLWKDSSYTLYESSDRWTVHVTPYGTPEAGDILKFRATKTSGVSQEFISTLTYVFEDIPKLVAYVDANGTQEGDAKLDLSVYQGNSNKFNYSGSQITFRWTPPKDDLGNYITGMQYYLDGINYYDASGTVVRTVSALAVTPDVLTDPVFGTVYSVAFTPTTESFSYFKVDVKSQSPTSGGGNASQLILFNKI